MRKVFSSQRLENVEAVAKLLQDQGIEVRIEHPRSFRNAIRGNFSYRDDGTPKSVQPAVWVVRSDDQPRARALLREAGLLQDTTRAPMNFQFTSPHQDTTKRRVSRLRYGLLALIVVVVTINIIGLPGTPPKANTAAGLTLLDEVTNPDQGHYTYPTPPLLAVMLAKYVIDRHRTASVCLTIDDHDPPDNTLMALHDDGLPVEPGSACQQRDAMRLNVHDYITDGSGTGTIRLHLHHSARDEAQRQTLSVRRSGNVWTVLPESVGR